MRFEKVRIFDTVRLILGRGFTPTEVNLLDSAIDAALVEVCRKHEMRNLPAFFKGVRVITGPLDQGQVDTINRLLAGASHWPTAWLAKGLATAWHEARLEPIEEWGKGRGRPYGKPGKYSGQCPYGRGLVQLTHDFNYEWADKALGLDGALLKDFGKALDPDIASRILIKGMEEGAFCPGNSLAKHLPDRLGTLKQFIGARRIINGTDKAEPIARLALGFQDAIEAGRWS